jgi:hypothetical protein
MNVAKMMTFCITNNYGGIWATATYQAALIAALDDEVISEDEWALLDHLRRSVVNSTRSTCND